jgi:hypothetical protein
LGDTLVVIQIEESETAMSETTTAASLKAKAAQHEQNAADSFESCDTDGFLSQWASGLSAQQARKQAEIEEAGGIATFFTESLIDADGNPIAAKQLHGQYGYYWALLDESGQFTGTFASAGKKGPTSKLAKLGLTETKTYFTAPAKAKIMGSGKGLAGAASCHTGIAPTDPGTKYDGCLGAGDQTGEQA